MERVDDKIDIIVDSELRKQVDELKVQIDPLKERLKSLQMDRLRLKVDRLLGKFFKDRFGYVGMLLQSEGEYIRGIWINEGDDKVLLEVRTIRYDFLDAFLEEEETEVATENEFYRSLHDMLINNNIDLNKLMEINKKENIQKQ